MKWFKKAADQGHQKAKDVLLKIQAATPSSLQNTGLSLKDNGHAWQAASRDKRIALCMEIVSGTGLPNDYKYWLYNIDDCYRTSETLDLSIQLVVDTIKMQISINERQKYLGR